MKSFRKIFFVIGIIVVIAVVVYSVLFGSVLVKDRTMAKTFQPDERVLVFEAEYGIKLPLCDKWLLNYSSPKRGDIIAFHLPKFYDVSIKEKPKKISRCIGLPGDTLQLISKKVYVNGKLIEENENIEYQYRIVSKSGLLDNHFFEKYNLQQERLISEVGIYDIPLTKTMSERIAKDSIISNVRLLKGKTGYELPPIFPHSSYYSFTKDNFGPVVVPYKSWTVPVNVRNIGLYKRIISQYENNTVNINKGKVYINSTEVKSYVFKNNYYFVLDDNRDNAEDSRHWGFLPENHIVGKVSE